MGIYKKMVECEVILPAAFSRNFAHGRSTRCIRCIPNIRCIRRWNGI